MPPEACAAAADAEAGVGAEAGSGATALAAVVVVVVTDDDDGVGGGFFFFRSPVLCSQLGFSEKVSQWLLENPVCWGAGGEAHHKVVAASQCWGRAPHKVLLTQEGGRRRREASPPPPRWGRLQNTDCLLD